MDEPDDWASHRQRGSGQATWKRDRNSMGVYTTECGGWAGLGMVLSAGVFLTMVRRLVWARLRGCSQEHERRLGWAGLHGCLSHHGVEVGVFGGNASGSVDVVSVVDL